MSIAITDDVLRSLLRTTRSHPLDDLEEDEDAWHLGTFSISKHSATWNNGWTFSLQRESRLYKRWFDLADLGVKGWVIIFRVDETSDVEEQCPGWVPPKREKDADRWIKFLNTKIRERLAVESAPLPTARLR